jgi:sporulation-control protein spo0M
MPAWTRRAVAQTRVAVGRSVDPGGDHELAVEVAVPADCARSSESVAITVNVQADIKGQIDPTGNCRLTVT